MPDGVHAEFAQDQRTLAGEILQPQQVTLEIALVVQVNIETAEVGVLRQEIFRWRIRGIGKERLRINCAANPNQFLYKFNHATRAEPACHGAGDFVPNEVTENCRMPRVRLNGCANVLRNLFAERSFTQELDMFFPGQRHQHAHPSSSATIQEPAGRRMINSHHIQASPPHESQIDIDLLRPAKIISFGIRLERSVRNAFDKKLPVAVGKKFRSRANSRVGYGCHVERSRDISRRLMGFNQEIPRLRSE